MDRNLAKAFCKILNKEVEKADFGYEMGCLISSEFTPATTYENVVNKAHELCKRVQCSFEDFLYQLQLLCQANIIGQFSIYAEIYRAIMETIEPETNHYY